jgi:hypothetical protein
MLAAMRIGVVYEWKVNIRYRSMIPFEALRRRGHEVVFTRQQPGDANARRLAGCDVIHGYRLLDDGDLKLVRQLVKGGAAFVWDTDDDLASLPKESPYYRQNGALNAQRIFAQTVRIAREADVVTTSTEPLRERYAQAGIERIEVLGNYLDPAVIGSRRRKHDGVVIGWTAGLEHASELPRIPIVETLQRLLDAHPQVRVASLGLDLGLPRERYEHHAEIHITKLQEQIGRWDVAIAPLADIPFNRTRSDVKLKEYAAAGTPWLASPIGPYARLGEEQGGRLVPDDGWADALDALVRHRFDRFRLSRKARAWAKAESIERHAGRWERVCEEAVQRRLARAA